MKKRLIQIVQSKGFDFEYQIKAIHDNLYLVLEFIAITDGRFSRITLRDVDELKEILDSFKKSFAKKFMVTLLDRNGDILLKEESIGSNKKEVMQDYLYEKGVGLNYKHIIVTEIL